MPLQPLNRDEVLALVKSRGPIIPNELRKLLKQGDTVLLGAMLSEMASKGLVKISHTKIGGSPFYYDPAQAQKLESVAQHLNEKDQRTVAKLKEAKVLRDQEQDMLTRVSFRNSKDFAIQVNATDDGEEVVFFKYFLVPDAEAQQLIKRHLAEDYGVVPEPAKPEPARTEPTIAKKSEEALENDRISSKSATLIKVEALSSPTAKSPVDDDEFITEVPEVTKPKMRPSEPVRAAPKQESKQELKALFKKPEQQPLAQAPIQDDFYAKARAFFDENNIVIKDQKMLKKGEFDLIVLIPTPVGAVEYFCKARAKKKSSDGDLAAAKLEGHAKGLPVLYLTTGEVSKKAKEALATTLKGVVVKELS